MAVSLGLRGIKYVIPSRLLRRGSVARAKVSLLITVATQHDVRNLMLEKFVRSRAILRQLIKRFYIFFLFFFFLRLRIARLARVQDFLTFSLQIDEARQIEMAEYVFTLGFNPATLAR